MSASGLHEGRTSWRCTPIAAMCPMASPFWEEGCSRIPASSLVPGPRGGVGGLSGAIGLGGGEPACQRTPLASPYWEEGLSMAPGIVIGSRSPWRSLVPLRRQRPWWGATCLGAYSLCGSASIAYPCGGEYRLHFAASSWDSEADSLGLNTTAKCSGAFAHTRYSASLSCDYNKD